MLGGVGQAKEANDEIQAMCEQLRAAVEDKAGTNFDEYTVVSYSTQVVAGTNYFIKIKTGAVEFIHIRVHQPLPQQGDLSVHSIQMGKTMEDAISHF